MMGSHGMTLSRVRKFDFYFKKSFWLLCVVRRKRHNETSKEAIAVD